MGMHPDGATQIIIEYAALHRLPFAVVPCCSDNGMSYKPWMRHLAELARRPRLSRSRRGEPPESDSIGNRNCFGCHGEAPRDQVYLRAAP